MLIVLLVRTACDLVAFSTSGVRPFGTRAVWQRQQVKMISAVLLSLCVNDRDGPRTMPYSGHVGTTCPSFIPLFSGCMEDCSRRPAWARLSLCLCGLPAS
mmetsp:Transcript_40870/g.89033  ORF Transcript_40870/g.89033 Transcript_40870/m.89033 type:complete len:100 (-) Transcript_40870:66-365(-)